ncbi:MAG TPA: alkaline phosphatase D family protein [Bdellovibrionales bacterium]|nr:alkaline phosphatase D family protein [Bdellovibrionales bacterium]
MTRWILIVGMVAGLSACATGPRTPPINESSNFNELCASGMTAACAITGQKIVVHDRLAVMQGPTSAAQTRFAVALPKKTSALYFWKGPRGLSAAKPERRERKDSALAVDQLEVFGIELGAGYELFVLDEYGKLLDQRRFRALDLGKEKTKLAVVSCADDELKAEQFKMWPQLLKARPDAILMIGDNAYASRKGDQIPEYIWRRYAETRAALEIYKVEDLVPIVATWDDHDYGAGDGDRTFKYKDEAREIFFAFFPQTKPGEAFARGPGVASSWDAFGVRILLTDDRSFRSPNRLDLPDETHFGVEQEAWIQDELKTAKTPVLLTSGDQFFGGYQPRESYQGNHPKSFETQLKAWRKTKVPVVFVSGDRHLTEIIKVPREALGYPTFEITSSPIHARVYPGAFKTDPSPRQLVGIDGVHNYAFLKIEKASAAELQLQVESYGMDEKRLFERKLQVKRP